MPKNICGFICLGNQGLCYVFLTNQHCFSLLKAWFSPSLSCLALEFMMSQTDCSCMGGLYFANVYTTGAEPDGSSTGFEGMCDVSTLWWMDWWKQKTARWGKRGGGGEKEPNKNLLATINGISQTMEKSTMFLIILVQKYVAKWEPLPLQAQGHSKCWTAVWKESTENVDQRLRWTALVDFCWYSWSGIGNSQLSRVLDYTPTPWAWPMIRDMGVMIWNI